MKEISLNILDITQNSITAGASEIILTVDSRQDKIVFCVKDNGCGMSPEMLANVCDPFTTSRKTRKVGMGIPLLKDATEQTGGGITIESEVGKGTILTACFVKDNIDCPPLGDMPQTISLLIQSSADRAEIVYNRITDKGMFELSTKEMKDILGEGISLTEPDILIWIQDYVREQEAQII